MKLSNTVAKIGAKITAATVAMSIALSRVRVQASESVKDFFSSPTTDPATGITPDQQDIFGGVTKLVKSGGASLRSLITAIGVVFLIVSISLAALGLTKKNAVDRDQSKQRLVYLIIGAIIFFGSLTLLIFAQKISGQITDAVDTAMVSPTP